MPKTVSLLLLAALSAELAPVDYAQTGPQTYDLPASATTVLWGYYDAAAKPVLRIHSGDTVVIHTVTTASPARLEKVGVAPADVEQSLRDIDAIPLNLRGPGGHALTGPVWIEGAEPGDVLEIHIKKIELATPYAYNSFRYGPGFLSDDFYSHAKLIPLDREKMIGHFAPGIELPLHPFFGSMGVAPPPEFGRYDSVPPTIIGGNMDNKELVAGTTLFLPVYAAGALFEIGDGHAGQGNGEVDGTALETSLIGTLEFVLRKDMKLAKYPRAETPTHYIAMGFDDDLSEATRKALREMVAFLVAEKKLSRDDAYMLISVAGDVEVTELVDRNKGVHVMMPKAIFLNR